MKCGAMILAAGQGKRLRPLTEKLPKPLVEFRGKPMIDYSLEAIAATGIQECLINLFYKGEMIEEYVGDGSKWGLNVVYSHENKKLSTGGGVLNALAQMNQESFLLVNCDLSHDIDLGQLLAQGIPDNSLAHLVLTKDKNMDAVGDFSLQGNRIIPVIKGEGLIFCGVSIINPQIFASETRECFPLADTFHRAMANQQITGEIHQGIWSDLGTPQGINSASVSS